MSAKSRKTPKDLVLSVPLARRPGAKARRLPRTVPAVQIPLYFFAISKTSWRCRQSRANPSPISGQNHVLLRFFDASWAAPVPDLSIYCDDSEI